MSLVGVVAENKDFDILKKRISKENLPVDLVQIKDKSIENVKNIKFDTLIINKEIKSNKQYLKKILDNSKYLVINTDIDLTPKNYENIKLQIITYGFNTKATITASSVTENNIMLCTQRNIKCCDKKEIEQQECNIKTEQNEFKNAYNAMAYFAINCIYK